MPGERPLNAKVTGSLIRKGYRIEKIQYESFPQHHVTANLYLSDIKGKLPAAILFCGHEDQAKATESYQQTAILLATNGFVVLVVDPISQSERHQLISKDGKPLTRGGTTEHTLLNQSSNLVGSSAPADELLDNIRSMDYLYTRPEVDTSKIGCIGNSGGAMQCMYFAGYDRRVKLVVVCSYLATRDRTFELSGPADGCAQIPGEGKAGLELNDYLLAAAPAPVLVLAGRYDFIDYTGTVEAFNELKTIYKQIGHESKVSFFTYDDGHGISKPKREVAVTWFRKWFYNDSKAVKENELMVSNEKELMVTETGQVGSSFNQEMPVQQRNRMLSDSFASQRARFLNRPKADVLADIRKMLSLPAATGVENEDRGKAFINGISFTKIILRSKDRIPVPILIAKPSSSATGTILWISDAGKKKIADSNIVDSYLKSGYNVILADLSGFGETMDSPEFNDKKYFNKEYRNAMIALHIGLSLAAIRTADLLQIFEFIKMQNSKALPITIHASGDAGSTCFARSIVQ